MPPNAAKGLGLKDWALLTISALFVLVGIVLLPTNRDVAIVNIAFFGLCAAVGFLTIRRKLRHRNLSGPLTVQAVGGAPIRESRARVLALGGALAGLGLVIVVFGGEMGAIMRGLGALIAAVGSITFERSGLTIASRKWTFRVPWDNIAEVGSAEISSNPALVLRLHDRNDVAVTPAASAQQVQRRFASNTRWVGAPVAIMTSQYAIDLPILVQAVDRYVANPAARAELAERLLR